MKLHQAPFTADHYPTLLSWWQGHGWPSLPLSAVPPRALFAYALTDIDGQQTYKPYAFICAHCCDGGTGLAFLSWILTDPSNTARESHRALDFLLPAFRDSLTRQGFPYILASTVSSGLSALLQRHHFRLTDQHVLHHLHTPPSHA